MIEDQRIVQINLDDEMKTAYIDYSMSVIVSRALPDVRDGLKPVHRRVLYGMSDLGIGHNRPHKKSARIVGEVLGKYHPHGDSSVYDTMVRMAQDWSMRYPLVDGQGNYGSMDGDSPAAMRYTEARFTRMAEEMLRDLDKETVNFTLNFDDTLEEPSVLPTRIPNLLINGTSGIAVGMATNMLPHNLSEVIDGLQAYLANNDLTTDDILKHIHGPDLPTGGIIYGTRGIRDYFETGRGRIVVRGKAEIEEHNGRESIIITEIPYQVNKAQLVVKIAELVNEGKIVGVSDTRDESDRNGLRIVIDIRKDAMANVVLSKLYKYTPLQSSYGVNSIALVKGRPMTLTMKDIMRHFIEFRIEVVVKRAIFDLRKAEERAHILEGLLIALDHLDEVIALIRNSKTVEEAHEGLVSTFGLSDIQAKAILEMRLQRLTGLERQKIKEEYDEILKNIEYLKKIINDEGLQKEIVSQELAEIKEKYGDGRRTDITFDEGDINIEDLIADETVAITISHLGYIKRTLLREYKPQRRGGRGSKGSKTRSEDFIEHMFIATNHNYLLLFTEKGRCFWLRVFEIPEATKVSTGRVIQNIINLPQDDKVKAYIPIEDLNDKEFINSHHIVFCTKKGMIKKTLVEEYSRPRSNGINAITIGDDDTLLEAKLTNGASEIILANNKGYAIRFNETKVRSMGRNARGVRGMRLGEKDVVVGMVCVDPNDLLVTILVVSVEGNGKRTALEDYRVTNRGGKGVKTMKITTKTGDLVAIKSVYEEDEMMITTEGGVMIRMALNHIRIMGRATQGVRLIRIDEGDRIADVAVIRAALLDASNVEEE